MSGDGCVDCDTKEDLIVEQWHNVTPRLSWLYTPHRFLLIFILLLAVTVINPALPYYKVLFFWMISTFLIAACVQDGLLIRPHPFIWRLVLSFSIVWTITIFGLCLLERDQIMNILSIVSPSGKSEPVVNRDYSMGCDIWDKNFPEDPLHNVKAIVFDEFAVGHLVGWIVTAMMLRDTKICWIVSILFEFVERALKHWFANFNECWWDSVILDVLICNGLGIWIGMQIVKVLVLVPDDTKLLSECVTKKEKLQRIVRQLTPKSYSEFKWKPLKTPKRYYMVYFAITMILLFQMNVFALKMILQLPLQSTWIMIMLALHITLAEPAMCEGYMYATGKRNTIGNAGCCLVLAIAVEDILIARCSEGYFTAKTPTHVAVLSGLFFLVTLVIFPLVWFKILKKGKSEKVKKE